MTDNAGQEMCSVIEPPPVRNKMSWPWSGYWPGPPVPATVWAEQVQTFLTAWTETLVEALQKLRDLSEAQCQATRKAIEAGFLATAARKPEEFGARLAEFWQKSFDCLRPMADLQVQAARFAEALGRHMTGAMETVSEADYQGRLAICRTCDFFQDGHCLKCGCRLTGDVMAKARWATGQCPLGKWDSIHLVPVHPG